MSGIYIHIPFCRQACNYCNFHFSVSLQHKKAMVAAIVQEITSRLNFIPSKKIATVYIGGGTPSLLLADELSQIITAVYQQFDVAADAEITLEANPDDINDASLQTWLHLGINRLSVGLQSFNENELKWMNRAHNATQSIESIAAIKRAGFQQFSVDLIYGSPLQTDEDLIRNFNIIAAEKIPHISCYALTVEPGTLLNQQIAKQKMSNVDADKQAAQFELLLQLMKNAGYEQYEISNFCLPGHRSKHNSSYWQGKPYWGFGPSAHSFNGENIRRWNVANNSIYIKSIENNIVAFEEEILTKDQQFNEYVMTALRTIEGINTTIIKEKFGGDYLSLLSKNIEKYTTNELLVINDDCVVVTAKGKFLVDGIASNLFV
ncbi:radical SAM family heme chaperone HemW [Ferruginibacter yonginensis]|uniref:Heme chaperone HemW n=1 Tax=Ferruginibacter yonginensis TaxID=1310416 RepID=A0ABV8QU02_9BACT